MGRPSTYLYLRRGNVLFTHTDCAYLRWGRGLGVRIFVASMLTMGALAAYLAITRHQPNNIGGGILTFYLIGTAWLTARRKDGETSRLDWVALVIPLANGILSWMTGVKVLRSGHSSLDGVPVGMILFMGSVCLLAAAGHAGARRRFWSKAHRAASLAHVLWAVYCSRVFFLRRVKPPTEIAFDSGARKISIPGFIQHNLVFGAHPTSADFDDFLVSASALHKHLQENRNWKLEIRKGEEKKSEREKRKTQTAN